MNLNGQGILVFLYVVFGFEIQSMYVAYCGYVGVIRSNTGINDTGPASNQSVLLHLSLYLMVLGCLI